MGVAEPHIEYRSYKGPPRIITLPYFKISDLPPMEGLQVEIREWTSEDTDHVKRAGWYDHKIHPLLVVKGHDYPSGGSYRMFVYQGGLKASGDLNTSADPYYIQWVVGTSWLSIWNPDTPPSRGIQGWLREIRIDLNLMRSILGALPEEWWTFRSVSELKIVSRL